MTKYKSFFDMLKTTSEAVGTDEYGATKGCACPICQIRRSIGKADEPGNVETLPLNIDLVAYFATDEDSISIGYTASTDTDTQQRVAIRIGSDTDGMLFDVEEARLIVSALQMAIKRVGG